MAKDEIVAGCIVSIDAVDKQLRTAERGPAKISCDCKVFYLLKTIIHQPEQIMTKKIRSHSLIVNRTTNFGPFLSNSTVHTWTTVMAFIIMCDYVQAWLFEICSSLVLVSSTTLGRPDYNVPNSKERKLLSDLV